MIKLAIACAVILAASPAFARGGGGGGHSSSGHSSHSGSYSGTGSNSSAHGVRGYTTGRGTYVAPHQQTNPNTTMRDNYGARGNVNPSNGAVGQRLVPY